MRTKNLLLCLLIAAGASLAPFAGHADSRVSIGIAIGPPPPPVVVAPAPVPGYVWAPGYWGWNGYQYVWVEGRWLVARPGYYWVPDRWVRSGQYWRHDRGHWGYRYRGREHREGRHHDRGRR